MAGWKSRKLWLAIAAMGLTFAGYGFTGFAHDLFGTFCTALVAAAGIYSGGAVAERFAETRK